MKILQKRIPAIFIALVLGFFSAIVPAFSQQNAQSVYNSTVDQINCETIRFIHREAGRAEIANNMECFSFESILKSIPEDESNTTAKVSKDIEAFKTKYKADQDLAAQLDNVIAYADKKIESKPRKGNVEDFKKKLQDYKADALENINGAPTTNTNTVSSESPNAGTETAIDEEDAGDDNAVVTPVENQKHTDWLGWLSLLISLASLGLSAYLLNELNKVKKNLSSAPIAPADTEGNRPRGPQVNESAANYKLLETKMYQEIAKLNRDFEDKLSAVTASTGYTQPESYSQQQEIEEEEEEINFPQNTVKQSNTPAFTNSPYSQPAQEEVEEEEETPLPVVMEEVVEDDNADEDEEEEIEGEYVEEDIENEEEDEQEPVVQNTFRSDASADMPAKTTYTTQADIEEEDEDGVALPDYKYIGLPLHDGSFSPTSFTDTVGPDSLYEVEMYEDVPNKAFFSPLQYPEIIEKALSDPETYLAPCCMFLNDPAGKQIITVVEEGRLRRQGERWYIYEKARIRFD